MGWNEAAVRRVLSGKAASLDLTLEALRALGVRATLAAWHFSRAPEPRR